MGEAKRKKAQPIIHSTKLFGGRKTAEEIYQEIAVNRKCFGCSSPGLTKLATLVSYNDLVKRAPGVIRAIMSGREPGSAPPVIKTVYGAMICVAELVACKSCTPEAERAASRGEREWSRKGITVHVEIRRGPGVDIPVFQVPAGPTEDESLPPIIPIPSAEN